MAEPTPTHLEWPLRLAANPDGSVSYAQVEQDSREEVYRAAGLICELRVDQLPWNETLGVPSPLASTDPDQAARAIERALTLLEPRLPFVVEVPEIDGTRRIRLALADG